MIPENLNEGTEGGLPQPRLVRLEVAMIATRSYTKIVEIPEDAADGICGMIYNNGWGEEECATYINNADGTITDDEISHVVDTIDVLHHPDGEGGEDSLPNSLLSKPGSAGTRKFDSGG